MQLPIYQKNPKDPRWGTESLGPAPWPGTLWYAVIRCDFWVGFSFQWAFRAFPGEQTGLPWECAEPSGGLPKNDGFGAGKWDVATIATQVTGQFELIWHHLMGEMHGNVDQLDFVVPHFQTNPNGSSGKVCIGSAFKNAALQAWGWRHSIQSCPLFGQRGWNPDPQGSQGRNTQLTCSF